MILSVEKLRDDLELWIQLGIADDVVRFPDLRPEYQELVAKYKNTESILTALKIECRLPWYKRPTQWVLIKLFLFRWGKNGKNGAKKNHN